jgi:hypothetical protein
LFRILAARHSIAGQGLAKAVCKATTEEVIGPKKKHLDCKFEFYIQKTVLHDLSLQLNQASVYSYNLGIKTIPIYDEIRKISWR